MEILVKTIQAVCAGMGLLAAREAWAGVSVKGMR